jgi:hypothetical protein
VFIEQHVSVTCSVDRNGAVCWWLTKESGELPVIGAGCGEHVGDRREDIRRSYLIIQRESPGGGLWRVLLSVLSRETVRAAADLLGVEARQLRLLNRSEQEDFVSLAAVKVEGGLANGAFSAPRGCVCRAVDIVDSGMEGVCALCLQVLPEQRVFMRCNGFGGTWPYGRRHWFKGVTDGASVGDGQSWLRFGYKLGASGILAPCRGCSRW